MDPYTLEDEDEPKFYDGHPAFAVCADCDAAFEVGQEIAKRPLVDTVSLIAAGCDIMICVPCRVKLEAAAL